MAQGVSRRPCEGVVDHGRDGFGVKTSSVSLGSVRASRDAPAKFSERRFDHLPFEAVIFSKTESSRHTRCAVSHKNNGFEARLGRTAHGVCLLL